MSSALISVALCTYNGEKYLDEQLQSILNQTYQNLEIIIVDDCSTDNTYNIIKNYADKDKRIKCFKNNQNLGFNKNFEKAIGLTTGDFIAISDQDDIWKPFKLKTLIENIDDTWLIFSNSIYINQNGTESGEELLPNFSIDNKTYKSILLNNWVTGHTTLFKRAFLSYVTPFPDGVFYDWWIGFIAVYHQKITYVKEALTLYRIHQDSVIQQSLQLQYEKNKKQQFDLKIKMNTAFTNYNLVTDADKKFITALLKTLILKKTYFFFIPLVGMIYNHYNDFYPDRKTRKGLSKLNFSYKIVKTM